MAIEILMPALSPTMTEGTLSRWLVKEGDEVKGGDVVAEIETDKATMEVESVDDGVVGRLEVEAGKEGVKVNSRIAILLEEGEGSEVLDGYSSGSVNGGVQVVAGVVRKEEEVVEWESGVVGGDAATVEDAGEWEGETKMVSVREALRDAMAEEMRRDGDVFLMGEEVGQYQGAYKVSQGLLEEFGERRVIDTPITESGFAGLGVGAAYGGLRPIVEFMTFNFAMQAIDHILNSAAKTLYMSGGQMSVPIVFRGPNGAASRVAAQHSQCYASWYAHCPGLKVVSPYSGSDAKGLLKSAIRDMNPVVFLENELLYGQEFEVPSGEGSEDYVVPLGKARVVRQGSDVTITAFSRMVGVALAAALELSEQEGIEAEVIDLRSLRPLDRAAILGSLAKTNRLVSVEEGWSFAGIGSEIAGIVMEEGFDDLDAPVMRVSGKDVPLPYAANLESLALPRTEDVVRAAKKVCYREL
jgi:pyruvate dehydrogenase E1 component beta subunit